MLARRERRAYPQRSVRSEQRSPQAKEPQPGGAGRRRAICFVASRSQPHCGGMLPPRASHLARRRSRQNRKLFLNDPLVPHFINTATFATRDFWPRRGPSDAHTLQGEWHLHKTQLAQTRNCATDMAFWPVAKFVTRRAEPRVFVSYPFDGSRLASFRSLRHQIGSQRPEQL